MLTVIGQCRGDMGMLKRQLERARIATFVDDEPRFAQRHPADRVVILGDLVSPLNAWCAFAPRDPSDDADILQLAVLVAEQTGARIVEGLHEMLLFGGDKSRCHTASGHRALLALVRSTGFLARWSAVSGASAFGVTRACRSARATLQDNASLPPPSDALAPYWPSVSAFDRGTRYQHRELGPMPPLAWCSRAFAIHPSAMCTHLASIYARSRCGTREWATAVDGVVEQYRAFDEARRGTLLLARGEPVADDERGFVDARKADVHAMLVASLGAIVDRYKLEPTADALAAAATQRLFHKGPKRR
jgi:hypothetical protein